MAVAWPSKFPNAQRTKYTGNVELPIRETRFPSSTKRRRVEAEAYHAIGLLFHFDQDEFTYFWSFLRHKVNEGADVITMPVADGNNNVTSIDGVIMVESIQYELKEQTYNLRLNFKIKELTIPSEATFDSWAAS